MADMELRYTDGAIWVHEYNTRSPSPQPAKPKRKRGREPLYNTVEEKKRQNRQAQAAYRERQSRYFKELQMQFSCTKETISNTENRLRVSAYECKKLRARNMMLAQILSDNGIGIPEDLLSDFALDSDFESTPSNTDSSNSSPLLHPPSLSPEQAYLPAQDDVALSSQDFALDPALSQQDLWLSPSPFQDLAYHDSNSLAPSESLGFVSRHGTEQLLAEQMQSYRLCELTLPTLGSVLIDQD